ncbi:hypothetical protein TREVI0001_2199 [Treponema vincentii ATCC 35580]|uniref:Uncharacterized protein n=1 Tax=Treponema vincentii ATCC 35580 TaxID=596324 RepID=C8PQA3_9SPIR|nr:hypothetical protein TREVI0001_2199 [Treponema vincentii ATCC 35580]
MNGFSFSIHRRLAISDEKKLKKRKKTLDKTNGFVIHSFSLAAH